MGKPASYSLQSDSTQTHNKTNVAEGFAEANQPEKLRGLFAELASAVSSGGDVLLFD